MSATALAGAARAPRVQVVVNDAARRVDVTIGGKPFTFARALEQPADKPEMFTDATGKPTKVPVLDKTGVTGRYVSSEGLEGDAVWGTRGPWTMLAGVVGSEPVTIAILDHPSNIGYPTYWHARGYGLFAANMPGEKVFTNGKRELNFALDPPRSVVFRHRIVILGRRAPPRDIDRLQQAFASGS